MREIGRPEDSILFFVHQPIGGSHIESNGLIRYQLMSFLEGHRWIVGKNEDDELRLPEIVTIYECEAVQFFNKAFLDSYKFIEVSLVIGGELEN